MSKLTLDEAIKHCLEVAEDNERAIDCLDLWEEEGQEQANMCRECAADHRQLAEWLQELKEAKRLLKAAVKDFSCRDEFCYYNIGCDLCADCNDIPCNKFKWRYADEALKLIGGNEND